MAHDETVSVDGHRLKLTNLDKVLYPSRGTTKADVIDYYREIADLLIPHAEGRPATRKRWVNGVGTAEKPGEVFFQKNLDASTPSWVRRHRIRHENHTNEYPLVEDTATLIWLAQIASLEIHVPQWRFARNGRPGRPDRLVLDLDPGEGVGLPEVAHVARLARDYLEDAGVEVVPVTSGSKGIHLYAALDGHATSQQVSDAAHDLARALEADHPDLVVSDMKKSLRAGKVFVDWSQNNWSKTTVVPYSLRGRLRPTAAAPRTWKELDDPDLGQLEYDEVLSRMQRGSDPLAKLSPGRLSRPRTSSRSEARTDRLAHYRSKRDASKTPEPVPSSAGSRGSGRSFVIQEHHARSRHVDFRLEHDGVLVSWALPKGVPRDPRTNRLAVQTEDHPVEYGSFEGRIPKGEYGAGEVSIWDSGEYDEHTWRSGEEIIVTLHGTVGGGLGAEQTFALIHTGGEGRAEKNWLIHLMKPEADPPKRSRPKNARSSEKAATRPIRPMLATLGTVDDLDDEDAWALEPKWDGIRAIASVSADGSVRLLSRADRDMAVTYPDLTGPIAEVLDGTPAVLDGEIVALGRGGRPDFGRLQTRMGLTKKADVERAVRSTPVRFLVFDVLRLDGSSQLRHPYHERRRTLHRLVPEEGVVQTPPAIDADLDGAMRVSKDLGLEGIVAKRRDSTYRPGSRSRSWIKVKHHRTQEVIVAGWRPGAGRRSGTIGSLLLGIPDNDGLRYVGRVGTGFTDTDLADFDERFRRLGRKTSPVDGVPRADASDAHWLSPKLVGEVEFAEWTSAGRLRQPSWRGWRPDKQPGDVVQES